MTSAPDPNSRHEEADLATLAERCAELEEQLLQMTRINEVLMNRVEREMDLQGSSYSSFQTAIALDRQVKERTLALNVTLQTLERTNRELSVSHEAALAASRAKSDFLAAMSHELRTPMNGVVGMTELLLASTLDDRQRRSTEAIQLSALSLLRILNDILDFSKIEAGQLEAEQTTFDLPAVVEQTLQLFAPQVQNKQLTLSLELDESIPRVLVGDPTRFAQIITNLVGNALKFTSRGSIAITGRPCADPLDVSNDRAADSVRLRFEVHDTGIGISSEVLPKLFQSFFQADSSTTRQYGGTGLGLAIVHRLASVMGGDCGATSTEGVGSCFWFELPFLLPDEHSTTERPLAPSGDAVSSTETAASDMPAVSRGPNADAPLATDSRRMPHVLVVEDNEINQAVARGFLTSLGYRCTIVGNGQLAVDACRDPHDFDVVMMDWQMPVLDGLAATRRIREQEVSTGRRVPIIALTANALVGDRERCVDAGMDDFLSKPFRLSELAATLARWCTVPGHAAH